ncbi:MAG: PEP-CTERM sorting domain-containing protein [Alphaproteobacteria bacterium]|nr:MAG: PEP-CTERM sorting domain-containing protein [Alphaproteobacteria bacterium]
MIVSTMTVSEAAVVRVSEGDFVAGSGLITFSEFSVGTVNPTYTPGDYGGGAGSPTVTFDGFFMGQSLSANPGVDCPGAAASACVVGSPTNPLTLDAAAPDTFITTDGANPTSPVLSGTPRFNGPIAVLFDVDLAGVGFDGGFFDAAGSTGITAFARDGSILGTVVNVGTGIEFLGLVTDDGSEQIAGVFLDLVGSEPAGFAIDNLRFGRRGEVVVPGGGDIPAPAALGLLGFGIAALGALGRRRKA